MSIGSAMVDDAREKCTRCAGCVTLGNRSTSTRCEAVNLVCECMLMELGNVVSWFGRFFW
jgi:hypothetical protein